MKARNALTDWHWCWGWPCPRAPRRWTACSSRRRPRTPHAPPRGPARARTGASGRMDTGGQHGHHGWHRGAKAHRFSLSGLALRHQKDLALTPAQVESLRKLGTDAQRDAIKRQADWRLAELDLRTMMAPDAADPNKPRDLAKIETRCGRSRSCARMGAWPRSGTWSRAARC